MNKMSWNWEDLTEEEQLRDIYSDAYKEVHGIRPRDRLMSSGTVDELRKAIDRLHDEMNEMPGSFDGSEPWEESPAELSSHDRYLTNEPEWEELSSHPKKASMSRRPKSVNPKYVSEAKLRRMIRSLIREVKR
jgi:hypothetical protein